VGVGVTAVGLALAIPGVLDLILLAYGFMVAGLFVPTLAALFTKRVSGLAALLSAVTGGSLAIGLEFVKADLPGGEPILWALPLSLVALVVTTAIERAINPPTERSTP
jgi:solute:Na+ symporter, SSS family